MSYVQVVMGEAIVGWSEPFIRVQFAARGPDAALLERQLALHYPNSAVVVRPEDAASSPVELQRDGARGAVFGLEAPHGFPLRTFSRFEPDPLGVAVAAMEELAREESALVQILFQPAQMEWADVFWQAIQNPYKPGELCFDIERDDLRRFREKFSSPLFAVSVRLLATQAAVFGASISSSFSKPQPRNSVFARSAT